MLKQETFYEVQSWGCVSALLGLPAELNPHIHNVLRQKLLYQLALRLSMTNCKKAQKISAEHFRSRRRFLLYPYFIRAIFSLVRCGTLAVEDLRSDPDEQDCAHDRDEGLGQHVACVIDQAVSPCRQAIAQVAPNEDAGQEAAHKAQEAGHKRTDRNADHPVLERACKELRQTQSHESQNVVQQDLTGKVQHSGSRRGIEAHDHLQAAVDKTGEQTPLDAVAEGHQHERQHAQQGDTTAVGHTENFDVGQHCTDGDHQRALDQDTGLGIGFRHEDSSSHYNSTQKQKCAH